MEQYILGHEHVFNNEIVPDAFLGSKLLQKYLRNNHNVTTRFLGKIVPFLDKDIFDRFALFLENGENTVEDNIKECIKTANRVFMSDSVAINVLMMDMSKMGAGDVSMSLTKQFAQLKKLKTKYPINIFLAVDPRNIDEPKKIMKKYADSITGIKIYPLTGFFPYDDRLDDIYKWCVENNKPVISHCSHYNAVHYRGSDIDELLSASIFPIEHKHGTKKKKASNFCNPLGFKVVADKYPDLKIDIAHLGGYDEVRRYMKGKESWTEQILNLCKLYPNVYTDISYTMSYQDLLPMLDDIIGVKELRHKILYGSDYYMNDLSVKGSDFHTPIFNYLPLDKWGVLIKNWNRLLSE